MRMTVISRDAKLVAQPGSRITHFRNPEDNMFVFCTRYPIHYLFA